jgi:hypothetical protein
MLALGDAAHLGRDHALASEMHLRDAGAMGAMNRTVRHGKSPFAGMIQIRFGGSAPCALSAP